MDTNVANVPPSYCSFLTRDIIIVVANNILTDTRIKLSRTVIAVPQACVGAWEGGGFWVLAETSQSINNDLLTGKMMEGLNAVAFTIIC